MDDDATWLCYYSDFPLVKVVDDAVKGHWDPPIAGCRAFAVGPRKVLFLGSYADATALTELEFSPDELRKKRTMALDVPCPLTKDAPLWAFGVADRLHLTDGLNWYSVDAE